LASHLYVKKNGSSSTNDLTPVASGHTDHPTTWRFPLTARWSKKVFWNQRSANLGPYSQYFIFFV